VQRLLAVGERSKYAVEAFGPGAQWFATLDDLINEARTSITSGIAVLIKGSRANKLEKVAAALSLHPTEGEAH
jgi:UDP-N-acetylmuramoyl-tripeptide--D-alanyl-D-alanine ligase